MTDPVRPPSVTQPRQKRRAVRRAPSSGQQVLPVLGKPQPRPPELESCGVTFISENHHQFLGERPLKEYLESIDAWLALELYEVLRTLDYTAFLPSQQPCGRHPYHPRVLLGLVMYGCLVKQATLRPLMNLARADVRVWYLCGGLQPDHSTIGYFLQDHAEVLTEEYFVKVTRQLVAAHNLRPGREALDGTVVEAVASAYRTLRADAAREAATQAQAVAAAAPEDRKLQDQAERAVKAAVTVEERQAHRNKTKGAASSASQVAPSEPEAVLQPLKEGGIAPSYKPSVLVHESGFIIGQKVDPTSEQKMVEPLLEQHAAVFDAPPTQLLMDAGYHDEATLKLCVERDLDVLCPAGRESSANMDRRSDKRLNKNRFEYLPGSDAYLCPQGRLLPFHSRYKDEQGRDIRRFRVLNQADCGNCPQRSHCSKTGEGRMIKRYPGDELKEQMREILKHPQARQDYARRKVIVEPVFARLKEGQGLRRFHRRGLAGASLEFALHCLAHNLGLSARLRRKAAASRRAGFGRHSRAHLCRFCRRFVRSAAVPPHRWHAIPKANACSQRSGSRRR